MAALAGGGRGVADYSFGTIPLKRGGWSAQTGHAGPSSRNTDRTGGHLPPFFFPLQSRVMHFHRGIRSSHFRHAPGPGAEGEGGGAGGPRRPGRQQTAASQHHRIFFGPRVVGTAVGQTGQARRHASVNLLAPMHAPTSDGACGCSCARTPPRPSEAVACHAREIRPRGETLVGPAAGTPELASAT